MECFSLILENGHTYRKDKLGNVRCVSCGMKGVVYGVDKYIGDIFEKTCHVDKDQDIKI